ncbi:hypothetical protein [Streptomyces sp. VRA16 Mangrove soil]|uniref:hypothetical protein n=1 Tax=Streptomyces sp. VRA16 Mangrove soil TaxID=2817434 RepID=UPI001A9FF0D0|nr:hypothetical protein [Streptomyces sp. VRA16 Mangrove soil]MBO1330017.1 hypothetical protein [Streptomyces sp. VRA16 Mangrove soil]
MRQGTGTTAVSGASGAPGPAAPVGSGPGRLILPLAAALIVLTAAGPALAAPAASKERDTQLVYCLGDAHRGALVDAAVRLGLVRPVPGAKDRVVVPGKGGGPMTADRWARREQDDFGRACDALMAAGSDRPGATSGEDSGWLTTFVDSLPLLVAGAVLTLGGQYSERVNAERRRRRQQLEETSQAFRTAARQYLRAYEEQPTADHRTVVPAREALHGALAQITAGGARGRAARRAADDLPLPGQLPAAADGELYGTDERRHVAQTVRTAVDHQVRAVADLNRWAGYWWWRRLRERRDGGAP